jgi:hypothetical protein
MRKGKKAARIQGKTPNYILHLLGYRGKSILSPAIVGQGRRMTIKNSIHIIMTYTYVLLYLKAIHKQISKHLFRKRNFNRRHSGQSHYLTN